MCAPSAFGVCPLNGWFDGATGEERVGELWLALPKAALERARGDDVAAEATLRDGMAMLERLDARGPLLRTATGLARVYRDHDRGRTRSP